MRMFRRRVCAAVVLVWCATVPVAAQDGPKHFLWKVEGPGASTAYLLGSLHVLTADYYPLSPTIDRAFAASRTLVEEVDLDEMSDPTQMMSAMAKAMLTDGRSLDQLVSPATVRGSRKTRSGGRAAHGGSPAHEALAGRARAHGAKPASRGALGRYRCGQALLRSSEGGRHETAGFRDARLSARSLRPVVAEAPGRHVDVHDD